MTILSLEACLLALATLELDDVHLKMLHQVDTNDLQLVRSVCLKLVCRSRSPPRVDDRLIQTNQTPLFSIIDPQHTNWNDNQWRHLYALSNAGNERIIKKKKEEG